MTDQSDFSEAEWALLNRVPTSVAMGAAYAERDGVLALSKEMAAGLQGAIDAAAAFPDNAIIQALCLGMQVVDSSDDEIEGGVQAGETDAESPVEERDPEAASITSLELSGQAMALMTERAEVQEAIEFKHWLYTIADQVTLGAKSGGMLGFGGTQVSDAEKAYLKELRAAIGMPDDAAGTGG